MDLGYHGKVVGLTGAGSVRGIGFAIAKAFLQEGARVFVSDVNGPALDKAVDALAAYGPVKGYEADVANEGRVEELFARVAEDYGRLDVFVNNAGIYPLQPLCQMSAEQWDRTVEVNLRSVFLCCRGAAQYMKKTGGVILNAASYAALIPSAGSGAYAATKAAVYSLTKTFAAELAPLGIRVNGFVPGVIETPMTQSLIDKKGDKMLEQIALRRLGTPQDVARAVVFLGSEAAGYMTGTFMEISGGKLCVQNPAHAWGHAADH